MEVLCLKPGGGPTLHISSISHSLVADHSLLSRPSHADRLRDLEKKTGHSKVYFFAAIVALFSTIIFALGGAKLISDLFAFAYPAYMSFKAIESPDKADDVQWLTYWVVFAMSSIVENVMDFLVSWIPFYFAIKCAFFAWMYHPKFMGASLVYKQVFK